MSPQRLAFGDFVLDRSRQQVLRSDGTALRLTPRLSSALLLFVDHAGELLDRDTLMAALWPGLVVEENNLNQVVAGLRRALGDSAQGSRFIQTVPRRGFRFVAEVTPLAAGVAPPAAPAPAPARRPLLRWALVAGGVAALGGAGWWAWRREPAGVASGPTLAVLPFKPLVAQDRDPLLEVGMADSLIARLSTVPRLEVRPTGSVLRFAGPEQDPQRAARELGVTWIVDGSLQRRGDRLRVTARLVRAADGRAAWSGSFEEAFDGVFAVQDQISDRVMQALAPALGVGASAVPPLTEPGGTHSTDAYQLYLAASRRADSGRADGLLEAAALFRQALAIDPAYAAAWVGLAWAQRRLVWNADALPSQAFAQSSEALQRALDIAPGLASARAGVATTLYYYEFDWPGAERELRRLLATSPNVANAHWDLGRMLLTQGRIDEGFEQLRRARNLDPTSPVLLAVEASFLLDQGRLAEARTRLDRAFDFAPNLWLSHVARGQLYFAENRPEEGIAAMRRAVELADATTRPRGVLARHLAIAGRSGEARSILGDLRARAQARFVPPTTLAMVHAALGEDDAALDALELALATRDTRLIDLGNDPSWNTLRPQPRFAALLKKLRLDGYAPGLTPV